MPNLYKQYCYQDLDKVSDSIQSEVTFNGGLITGITNSSPDLTINYLLNGVPTSFVITPPSCTELGFDNSFTGITTLDSVEMSGLMITALIAAFAIKVLRRTF